MYKYVYIYINVWRMLMWGRGGGMKKALLACVCVVWAEYVSSSWCIGETPPHRSAQNSRSVTRVPSLQATVCSSVAGFRYCKLSVAVAPLPPAAPAAASPFSSTVAAAVVVVVGPSVGDRVTPSSKFALMATFCGV